MFERFTDRARKVMATANAETQRFGHECIGTEHIFLGLIKEGSGRGVAILKEKGVDIDRMVLEVEQVVNLKDGPGPAAKDEPERTPEAINVVKYALEEARSLGHDYIGTEHILLGLLRESDGIAAQVLANLGVKLDDVRASLE
ncbi:MAG: hypothetical protein ISS79_13130 [Phycisphaerae bacterium]|nr:hypothetical protein [Phycisphaerae bacterium]